MSTTSLASSATAITEDPYTMKMTYYQEAFHQRLDNLRTQDAERGCSLVHDVHQHSREVLSETLELYDHFPAYHDERISLGKKIEPTLKAMKTASDADHETAKTEFKAQDRIKSRIALWEESEENNTVSDLDVFTVPLRDVETQGSFCAAGYRGTAVGVWRGHGSERRFIELNEQGQLGADPMRPLMALMTWLGDIVDRNDPFALYPNGFQGDHNDSLHQLGGHSAPLNMPRSASGTQTNPQQSV